MKIDLTGAKVGAKFDSFHDGVLTLIGKAKEEVALIHADDSCFIIVNNDGTCANDDGKQIIKSKHVPRPWLKDLPDADLFSDYVSGYWLACDAGGNGSWYIHKTEPYIADNDDEQWSNHSTCWTLLTQKMPTLTGDQWKDSKISIKDLKAWQRPTVLIT